LYGQQFWKSYYNTLDLIITAFCGLTLVVIFFSGCSAKGEEVFDIFLLVVRNGFQFGRLALVMRKYVLLLAPEKLYSWIWEQEWEERLHSTSTDRPLLRPRILLLPRPRPG
jgi:hypothetical protein